MFEYNGHKYEIDLSDADVLEKYFEAAKKVDKALNEEPKTLETKEICDSIRNKCKAIRTFAEDLFGETAGVEMCGENNSLNRHMDAYDAILDEVDRQTKEQEQKIEERKRKHDVKSRKEDNV